MITLPAKDFSKLTDNLVNFIKVEIDKTGLNKAVLGLSGGIDSAVVAALCVRALGKENVTGICMPYRTSNPSSLNDALAIAENLGINRRTLEISATVDAFAKGSMVDDEKNRAIRLGNIMARVRMITLFDYSSADASIVFGTGNKSEICLGYFTLFGDAASAINPIGSVYKTHIFEVAKQLGLPQQVITKAPSADLFEGQTDENEIGFSYIEMDPVIHALTDLNMKPEDVVKEGFSEKLVKTVDSRIRSMAYKLNVPIISPVSE
jgi:NAD+ synthase